jgi:hypothetical protein
MNNLKKIDLPWLGSVFPDILLEIQKNDIFWDIDRRMQQIMISMRSTQNILLRYSPVISAQGIPDEQTDIDSTDFEPEFPTTMNFLQRFSREENADLGRIFITRLKPSCYIHKHLITGKYYEATERYNLVIDCQGDSVITCGEDQAIFKSGELWWVNNKERQESDNQSDAWSTHLIFDLMKNKFS